MSFLIIIAVVTIIVAPSFGAKNRRDVMKNVKDREWGEGEYHNDFSRVGSAEEYTPVKPIDLSGNAIENARIQQNEDLERITSFKYKVIESDDDKEK